MDFLRKVNTVRDRVTGGNTGTEGATGLAVLVTNIKQWLNDIMAEIISAYRFPWRKRMVNLSILGTYTTGTVAVTQGSRTVTGTGTSWTQAQKWQMFQVAGDDAWYTVKKVVSTTSIILASPYEGSTASGSSYTIYGNRVLLPEDCVAVRTIRNPAAPLKLEPFNDWMVDLNVPDILGKTGTTRGYILLGRTEEAYYDTGTVSISSATVTGTSTSFSADMEGRWFRVVGDKSSVRIQKVVSATELTLEKDYPGTTTAGSSYQIDAPGRMIVQTFPAPTSRESMPLRYLRGHTYLVGDNELSVIPPEYEFVELAGATKRALADDGQEDKAIAEYADSYNRGLAQMVKEAMESEEKDLVMQDGMRDTDRYPSPIYEYTQTPTITVS